MINYVEYLGMPAKLSIAVIAAFLVMQLIGEFLEFKGKVVPEYLKVRKYFARKKSEQRDHAATLLDVQRLLKDVDAHYAADNIAKRDQWMQWVNDRAEVYDQSIVDITKSLSEVTAALNANTKLTEEMFVQSSRDRIIDFSYRAADHSISVSREEFNRIFKVYAKYEKFLEEHDMTNGEIDIVYGIIKDAYKYRVENHMFTEDDRSR